MGRRWCTLEGGFLSYYENERSPSAIGRVDVTEVVSLAVSNSETMTGVGYEHTLTQMEKYVQNLHEHLSFKIRKPYFFTFEGPPLTTKG